MLPLVPEPMTVLRKEDLAQVDLLSDPTDANLTKVKFAFKILRGGNGETARDVIQWIINVERAFTGLNSNNGQLHYQMLQQFACGSAPSGFNHNAPAQGAPSRAALVATAQAAVNRDDGTNVARWQGLDNHLAAMQTLTDETMLAQNVGIGIVATALRELPTVLLPAKILQRVKRCLRREARKPIEMGVRECRMYILCINLQEIPRLPPQFNATQMLSDDEIVDILLFGTPKSWQREMDCQEVDPLVSAPHEAATFMERIEMSEDFDSNKKTTKVVPGKIKKKISCAKGNKDAAGYKHCMLHGNDNAHDASECKTLMAQAKKLKGNNSADKKGKGGGNKSWKNKAKDKTENLKKELAALIKKATEAIKKSEFNAIEPVKKRKVNWPIEEEELCALDAELKDFNYYEDLDKMDLKGESEDKNEEGEMDLSASEEVSDEVSV